MRYILPRGIEPRNKIRLLLLVAESNFRNRRGKQPRYQIFFRKRSTGTRKFGKGEGIKIEKEREKRLKKRDRRVSILAIVQPSPRRRNLRIRCQRMLRASNGIRPKVPRVSEGQTRY